MEDAHRGDDKSQSRTNKARFNLSKKPRSRDSKESSAKVLLKLEQILSLLESLKKEATFTSKASESESELSAPFFGPQLQKGTSCSPRCIIENDCKENICYSSNHGKNDHSKGAHEYKDESNKVYYAVLKSISKIVDLGMDDDRYLDLLIRILTNCKLQKSR